MKPFVNIQASSGNVVFNFSDNPVRDLVAFGRGYRIAARALVAPFRGEAYADYEGYPVLFLYRHALELYLKAVVYRGAMLMDLVGKDGADVVGLFRNHSLKRLLPSLRAIFRAMNWDFNGTGLETFDRFEEFVNEIDRIDPGSYAFRYPIGPTEDALLPRGFMINVANFGDSIDECLGYLEGAADCLSERFQIEAEARYEVQRILRQDDEA